MPQKINCFGGQNGLKMGQKYVFPKIVLGHLVCTTNEMRLFRDEMAVF